MVDYSKSVKEAYRQRNSEIIIGLTGKTGAGCSTVAKILQTANFCDLDLPTPKDHDFKNHDERKYAVTYKYMEEVGRWVPFRVVHASGVIFTYILEAGFNSFSQFISAIQQTDGTIIPSSDNLSKDVNRLKYQFEQYDLIKSQISNLIGAENKDVKDIESLLQEIIMSPVLNETIIETTQTFILQKIPQWKNEFERILSNHTIICSSSDGDNQTQNVAYVYTMQTVGNNIRCSGSPYLSNNSQDHFYDVAKRIDLIISAISKLESYRNDTAPVRICIDAIRNVYEAFYFKDKYSYFYLVSVDTDDSERIRRLDRFNQQELDGLDQTELSKDDISKGSLFYHQNMNECLSISDIHLYNPKEDNVVGYPFLSSQLLKYLCLMIHPGLITPTAIERCMQTAYVAKLNSGCLSRQVGAVITDKDFSIKAIGWNDVPQGQIPCNLRCAKDYVKNHDCGTFSDFEREEQDFCNALSLINRFSCDEKLDGLSNMYCFKDVYNAIKKTSNQVYTRALHAEENAFLQISKYGGVGIKGGKLFSTASPCELCSKKAFQLGIEEIYYIDPYPGISTKHILFFGKNFRPRINLFYGAIGNAYINLYTPRIPPKDEIELLTGVSSKEILQTKEDGSLDSINKMKWLSFTERSCSFFFYDRTHMLEIDSGTVLARKSDQVNALYFNSIWTGDNSPKFNVVNCSFNSVEKSDKTSVMSSCPSAHLPKHDKIEVDNQKMEEKIKISTSFENRPNAYSYTIPFTRAMKKGDILKYELRTEISDLEYSMQPYYCFQVNQPTKLLKLSVFEPNGLFQHDSVEVHVYAGSAISEQFLLDEQCDLKRIEVETDVFGKKTTGIMHEITVENPNINDSYSISWKFQ